MTTTRTPRDAMAPAPATARPSLHTGILDGNHGDFARMDVARVRTEGGIVAVIWKASEGKDWKDPAFTRAVAASRQHGLLVGAYHFGSGSSPGEVQAEHFLHVVGPLLGAEGMVLALDLENNPNRGAGDMSATQAEAFVQRVHARTGVWPLVYTGRYVRAAQQARGTDLAQCPLWMAAYGPDPLAGKLPLAWSEWALWQYTNGGAGPSRVAVYPRKTPGIGGCDRSVFRGTAEELRAWWDSQAVGHGP